MQRALVLAMVCAGLAHSAQPLYTIETAAGTSWTGDGRSAKSALLLLQGSGECVSRPA